MKIWWECVRVCDTTWARLAFCLRTFARSFSSFSSLFSVTPADHADSNSIRGVIPFTRCIVVYSNFNVFANLRNRRVFFCIASSVIWWTVAIKPNYAWLSLKLLLHIPYKIFTFEYLLLLSVRFSASFSLVFFLSFIHSLDVVVSCNSSRYPLNIQQLF